MSRKRPTADYSPIAVSLFGRYTRRYFRRRFNAMRILGSAGAPPLPNGTILYSNHSSWWDPLVMLLLATDVFPGHRLFAPMQASALRRYRILQRVGLFPLDATSRSGLRDFIEDCDDVLSHPGHCLVITAQGRFADQRLRPPGIQPGVAHLLSRNQSLQAVPLGIEYVFWNESLPEVLLAFGQPVQAVSGEAREALLERLEAGLGHTLDQLATASMARDPAAFRVFVGDGKIGVRGVYGRWQRLKSRLRGETHNPAHGAIDD